jgi:ribonuclease-3
VTADGPLDRLEGRLGYRFRDRHLLEEALTHSSAVSGAGSPGGPTYQRLEFLGDRVLALAVADMLLEAFPDATEGELARRLTGLVRNETCAAIARKLDLGPDIRLGAGEASSGGRTKEAILGDVCEAVIGAIYRDGGNAVATAFVQNHWREPMLDWKGALRDAKTTLQEWAQGRGLSTPGYRILGRSGPHHAPRFSVEVAIGGLDPGQGEGGSRREAEQNAAAAVLVREGIWKSEGR